MATFNWKMTHLCGIGSSRLYCFLANVINNMFSPFSCPCPCCWQYCSLKYLIKIVPKSSTRVSFTNWITRAQHNVGNTTNVLFWQHMAVNYRFLYFSQLMGECYIVSAWYQRIHYLRYNWASTASHCSGSAHKNTTWYVCDVCHDVT